MSTRPRRSSTARKPLTNTQITDRALVGAALFGVIALIVGAERAEPGFWFLAIDVAGEIIARLIDAFQFVAAFIVVGIGAWRASAHVTRRDLEQELAQKAAKRAARDQEFTPRRLLPMGGDN